MSNAISGNIIIPGTVVYSGTASGSVSTDGVGNYTISALGAGTYKVTPQATGVGFASTSGSGGAQSVVIAGSDVSGVNFLATPNYGAVQGVLESFNFKTLDGFITIKGTTTRVHYSINSGFDTGMGAASGVFTLTGVSVSGGIVTYSGGFGDYGANNGLVGSNFIFAGFVQSGNNGGLAFPSVTASTATSISFAATTQVNETHSGTATSLSGLNQGSNLAFDFANDTIGTTSPVGEADNVHIF